MWSPLSTEQLGKSHSTHTWSPSWAQAQVNEPDSQYLCQYQYIPILNCSLRFICIHCLCINYICRDTFNKKKATYVGLLLIKSGILTQTIFSRWEEWKRWFRFLGEDWVSDEEAVKVAENDSATLQSHSTSCSLVLLCSSQSCAQRIFFSTVNGILLWVSHPRQGRVLLAHCWVSQLLYDRTVGLDLVSSLCGHPHWCHQRDGGGTNHNSLLRRWASHTLSHPVTAQRA